MLKKVSAFIFIAALMFTYSCNFDDNDKNNFDEKNGNELDQLNSETRASGYFVSYRGPSYYNFLYKRNHSFPYTTHKDFWFSSGENVTLNADKVDGIYPTIYLFKSDDPRVNDNSWVSKSYNNSRLSVRIKESGVYRCLITKKGRGTCANLYKNGVSVKRNFIVSGPSYYPTFSASNVKEGAGPNFFTSNTSSGGDTILYVVKMNGDTPAGIIAWNDDADHSEWGYNSLCKIDPVPAKVCLMVFSYSSTSTGTTNMYAYVKVGNPFFSGGTNDHSLYMESSTSENDDNYNCFAWSGGITSKKIVPYDSIYSENTYNEIEAFDNYYANKRYDRNRNTISYPRYPGAVTYIPCNFNDPRAVIDLWGSHYHSYDFHGLHATVKNTENGQLHGFSWESKANDRGPRFFHERCAQGLKKYGKVIRSYRLE